MVTTPGPDRVLDRALLGPGFLSHVLTERFGNHMPYYRLEQKYASEGLALSRTVLQRSAARCAELLEPIAAQLQLEILASPVIHTDDTSVRLVHPKNDEASRLARLGVYLDREDRHWYDFTETRKRDGPQRVLGDYQGFVQADAYAGYDRSILRMHPPSRHHDESPSPASAAVGCPASITFVQWRQLHLCIRGGG